MTPTRGGNCRGDHGAHDRAGVRQSARIAAAIGPYERYAENRDEHNAVMRMHRDSSYAIPDSTCSDTELLEAARRVWDDAVAVGEVHGYRNAQSSVLAPTGTISFLMDCDTTGVEPDFSLVKFKELVGGGQMTIVNQTIPMALQTLGYTERADRAHRGAHRRARDDRRRARPAVEHLSVFDVAVGERAISHMGHIKMMGAVQPFISGAISNASLATRSSPASEDSFGSAHCTTASARTASATWI